MILCDQNRLENGDDLATISGIDRTSYLTRSRSEYLVVYRGESISRFIAHCCDIPCPAKYSVPFPAFALRWSSTSINFALPARGATVEKVELRYALTEEVTQHHPRFLVAMAVAPYFIQALHSRIDNVA